MFLSLRFSDEILAAAHLLKEALASKEVPALIVDVKNFSRIGQQVATGVNQCSLFVIFGTPTYGEQTATQGCTADEFAYATQLGKPMFFINMLGKGEALQVKNVEMCCAGRMGDFWAPNPDTDPPSNAPAMARAWSYPKDTLVDHITGRYREVRSLLCVKYHGLQKYECLLTVLCCINMNACRLYLYSLF